MKKLSRKIIREEQDRIGALQSLAEKMNLLEQARFLPQSDGFTIVHSEDGTPVIRMINKEPKVEPGEEFAAAVARAAPLRIRRAQWEEPQIHAAAAALRIERKEAVTASLQEIEANDLDPFFRRLQMLGPTLLADSRIILVVHDWWLGAKWGDKESAQRLAHVLKALTPGPGNFSKQVEEGIKDEIRLIYEEEYKNCQKIKKSLKVPYRNPFARLKSLKERFHLSPAEIKEGEDLTPSAWAVKRTATRLNLKTERVRRIILEKTKG